MKGRLIFVLILYTLLSCKQNNTSISDANKLTEGILDRTNDLLRQEKNAEALRYLDSAIRALPQQNHVDLWHKYRLLMNYYINYEINIKKATIYSDSMFVVLKGNEYINKKEYAETIFGKGDIFKVDGKYEEAFRSYYDGKNFAIENLDSCNYSDFTNRLGLIRYAQNQFTQAITYFKLALKENKNCTQAENFNEKFLFPQSILNNIAFSYEQSEMTDSAMHYYKLAISFIDEQALDFPAKKDFALAAKGVLYGNLGGLYLKKNNRILAEKYLKESIAINDKPNFEKGDAQTAKIKLANLYLLNANSKEALRLIDETNRYLSTNTLNNRQNQSLRLRLLDIKYRYYDQQKDFQQAFHYLEKHRRLTDSVRLINTSLSSANMEGAFKVAEQSYKLKLLNKENTYKNYLIVTGAIFSVIIIILLIILYKNLKGLKKNVVTLEVLNMRINNQNEDMRKALDALEQSQEDNTKMLKIIAHDLRSPIGAIGMLMSYMAEEKNRSKEDFNIIDMVTKSVNSSLDLVDNLLNIQSKSTELKKEPEDLLTILTYSVDQLKLKANSKNQQIHLEAQSLIIHVDSGKLWRVLSNLITNAIKFSKAGSIIKVTTKITTKTVIIAIKDEGIGIPDNLHTKIFEMFSDSKRKGTEGEATNGLGLSISKQIVEAHDGKIWFETALDIGTTFYIELPL